MALATALPLTLTLTLIISLTHKLNIPLERSLPHKTQMKHTKN